MNPLDWLDGTLSPEIVVTGLAAVAAATAIAAVWSAALVRDPTADRAKRLKRRRDTLRADLLTPQRNSQRRQQVALGLVNQVITRLNLLRNKQADKIALRLAQAGWRSPEAVSIFLFLKLCLPFAVGGLATVMIYGEMVQLPPAGRPIAAMIAVIVGAYLPEIFVKNAIDKRRVALQKGLPDTLDLLVICAEAGLALDAALSRVAGEMARSCPEIADEFGLTSIELGFLPVRRTALENLTKRIDTPAIRGVVNTLLQTEKYGTPLAQSLRVLAAEFRDERMLKAEEKAAKLPATMTVPLVLFVLPTLFIVLLGPAVLRVIDGLGGL